MADPKHQVVMIAVDNSSQSQAAFNWYMDHNYRPSHQVVIAHCMEQPVIYGGSSTSEISANTFASLLRKVQEEGQEVKDKYSALLDKRGVTAQFLSSMEIRPEYWITERAKEINPGLLVIGSRGLGKLRRTFLGSVSDHVLHHAHCPVAIYHG